MTAMPDPGETVWHSDIDPGACKVPAHRWPSVPNLGDITRIDWTQVEPVEVVTAGYPCQPFSLAGQRGGATDERHLWPYAAKSVSVLRPRLCVAAAAARWWLDITEGVPS